MTAEPAPRRPGMPDLTVDDYVTAVRNGLPRDIAERAAASHPGGLDMVDLAALRERLDDMAATARPAGITVPDGPGRWVTDAELAIASKDADRLRAELDRLRGALARAMTSVGYESTNEHGDDWATVAAENPDTFPDLAVNAIRGMHAQWASGTAQVGETWRKRHAAAEAEIERIRQDLARAFDYDGDEMTTIEGAATMAGTLFRAVRKELASTEKEADRLADENGRLAVALADASSDVGDLTVEVERLRALLPDTIPAEHIRPMLQLLGPARMVLDRAAVILGEHPGQPGHEAADMAQRIVGWIGHPVTDEPAVVADEFDRLRAELAKANTHDGHDLQTGVLAVLRHEGYTDQDIDDRPKHPVPGLCEFDGQDWDCTDGDGNPHHPLDDRMTDLAETLDVALTAIAERRTEAGQP
jgi:hypothetical protein